MYLRHTTRRKNGKTHTYWSLVRSVRTGRRVRQETVAQLGELDVEGRASARALAASLGARRPAPGLFDTPEGEERVAVRLKDVRLERTREFGAPWLAWTLWRMLHLDAVCAGFLGEGREDVPWSTMASILVMARLCEPSSELHVAERWYARTALDDLLGVPAEKVNDDRLYRALDRLLPHKEALERHLKSRLGELFAVTYDLLLYDVTSTYFEGEAEGNPMARRGHSRDHRPDCKQVLIALVVTKQGIPLGYEVFAGNRVDVTTVEEVVTAMEGRFGVADRVWVMDRGMVSEENLAWLKASGRKYLVGAGRHELKRLAPQLAEPKDWRAVREGLEVKLCAGPDGGETFVLCRSEDRRRKEQQMHERFAGRIVERLESLRRRLERARAPADRGEVERQIGRILGQNPRAAGAFQVKVDVAAVPSGLALAYARRPQFEEWARLTHGAYVLRTNVEAWTPEDLWQTYVQLSEAEAAFRIHKTDLSIRPVWHQRADRVQAHILICFLGYVLWKTLEQWGRFAGVGASPRTLLDEIGRLTSTDVVLPTTDGREVRLRCVVRPDRQQAQLLDRLGVDLPSRLRPRIPVEM
jgi:transposase